MRILCLDSYGESALDICLRMQAAGHQVRWCFAETPRNKEIGKGLVTIVREWRPYMKWADLVWLPDNTKYLRDLEAYRKDGPPIVGSNYAGAQWELDRDEGMRVLKRAGIPVPPYKEFQSYDDAIRYVKQNPARYVSKPSGVEGDKSLSYCSKGPDDMVFMLERWKKLGKLKSSFVLQDFVKGQEIAVGAWFGPGGFNEACEENYETKPLCNDDKGPNTGEMGTIMQFVKKSKLAQKLLKPLEEQLDKIGYVGCVDVSAIVDEHGTPWPLEFTMRCGWPAFQIQQSLQRGDPAKWMVDLAEGRDARNMELNRVAVGVVIGLPDFPYDRAPLDEVSGVPIYGIDLDMLDHLHPSMVAAGDAPQMVEDKIINGPCWVSAGTYLMTVTGVGDTVTEAKKAAYGVVDKLRIPRSPIFRTDIGDRLKTQLPKIQAHGFSASLRY